MKILLLLVLSLFTTAFAGSIFDQQNQNGNGGELTAQEEYESGVYMHEGKAQERYQEICTGKDSQTEGMDDICTNGDKAFDGGLMATLEMMMPMVNKAYSMIGVMGMMGQGGSVAGLSKKVKEDGHNVLVDKEGNEFKGQDNPTGGDPIYTDADGNPVETKDLKNKTENQKDMCAIIPGVTDLAANTMQGMENDQIQQSYQNSEPKSRQAESFYALQRSHESRQKTSKTQSWGWGATTGCYVAYAATGTAIDAKLVVKTTLSGLATTFYILKAKAHGEKAELLKKLGDSFPKAGECNPHTDTQCFCSEPSSVAIDLVNYQKYCVPAQYASTDKPVDEIVACIDAQGKPDPSCKCKRRRACIDSTLENQAIQVGLNPSVMRNAAGSIRPFGSGFETADIGPGIEQNLAMAKKMLSKYKPEKLPNLRGNKKAQKLAKDIASLGFPKAAALEVAAAKFPTNGNAGIPSFAAASLRDDFGTEKGAFSRTSKNAPKFKSGGSDPSRSKGGNSNPFAMKRGRGAGAKSGVQNVDYASLGSKASMEADITRDPSKGIFEILSHRYKMRAWKEFEDSMNKDSEL